MRAGILFLFSFLLLTPLFAQPSADKRVLHRFEGKPLSVAVKKLRKKHAVPFSFGTGSIDNIEVPVLSDTVSTVYGFLFEALLDTPLSFDVIGGTYVIFSRREEGGAAVSRRGFSLPGVVRDASTGEALPFAAVGVSGSTVGTVTATDGKFTLFNVPSDTALIEVQYLGYAPGRFRLTPLSASGVIQIDMRPSERVLPSVEISAGRPEMTETGSKAGALVFNPSEIYKLPNLGENDLFAGLRLLPGVSGSGEPRSGLRIRGGNADESLVLFDGFTVYHIDHFFGYLSAFNPNVVKNVQLSRGGYGPRYGGRASGLVNITGLEGNKKKPGLTVEAGLLSTSVLAELPLVEDKASLVFAYRRAYTDILQTGAFRDMFNNLYNSSVPGPSSGSTDVFRGESTPDFGFFDLNAKVHFRPTDRDNVSLSFYRGSDDLDIAFTGASDGVRRTSEDASSWGNTGASLMWSRKWNKRFSTYAVLGISDYDSRLRAEESLFIDDDELLSRRFFDRRTTLNDRTLRLDNTYSVSDLSKLEFGMWLTEYGIETRARDQDILFTDSSEAASLRAFYADYTYRLGKFTLNGGLRASHYTGDDRLYAEPRASVVYELSSAVGLKAAAGRYNQMIRRLNERSLYFSIPETWTLSREGGIDVLRSDHYVLGFNYNKKSTEIDIELYHRAERGAAEFLFPALGIPAGSLEELATGGERRIFGAEVLVKQSFGMHRLMASFTAVSARSRYEGVNGGNFFRSGGIAATEAGLVYMVDVKRWDFSASFTLASGLPYTAVSGTYSVIADDGEPVQFLSLGRLNAARTDAVHRLDVAAGYTVPLRTGALKFGVSVYNVYNRDNMRFVDYFPLPRADGALLDVGRRDIIGLGILPSAFIRLKI